MSTNGVVFLANSIYNPPSLIRLMVSRVAILPKMIQHNALPHSTPFSHLDASTTFYLKFYAVELSLVFQSRWFHLHLLDGLEASSFYNFISFFILFF